MNSHFPVTLMELFFKNDHRKNEKKVKIIQHTKQEKNFANHIPGKGLACRRYKIKSSYNLMIKTKDSNLKMEIESEMAFLKRREANSQ